MGSDDHGLYIMVFSLLWQLQGQVTQAEGKGTAILWHLHIRMPDFNRPIIPWMVKVLQVKMVQSESDADQAAQQAQGCCTRGPGQCLEMCSELA